MFGISEPSTVCQKGDETILECLSVFCCARFWNSVLSGIGNNDTFQLRKTFWQYNYKRNEQKEWPLKKEQEKDQGNDNSPYSLRFSCLWHCSWKKVSFYSKKVGITIKSLRLAWVHCWWLKSCTTWDVKKTCKQWDILPINWCRISAINRMVTPVCTKGMKMPPSTTSSNQKLPNKRKKKWLHFILVLHLTHFNMFNTKLKNAYYLHMLHICTHQFNPGDSNSHTSPFAPLR